MVCLVSSGPQKAFVDNLGSEHKYMQKIRQTREGGLPGYYTYFKFCEVKKETIIS